MQCLWSEFDCVSHSRDRLASGTTRPLEVVTFFRLEEVHLGPQLAVADAVSSRAICFISFVETHYGQKTLSLQKAADRSPHPPVPIYNNTKMKRKQFQPFCQIFVTVIKLHPFPS